MSAEFDRLAQALADRYRLERELGAGGMATVYLAHDLRHQRKVALKVLKPELAAVIGGERFLHEIRTTANLQHPHILPLFDSGTVEGTVFYVMPYVEGESLRDRLAREKQLPIPDAVRIAQEVAAALDYAHRHGVIHRDIKPENILLPDGQALVADFGIALAASSAGGSRMTESGMSLGTPRYMSPEQAMGEHDITPRSDVYALGCVLYEMLTGDPPFTGSTAQAIIAQIITEDPRAPSVRRPTTPPEVEEAVLTALARLPADRFPSAAAFSTALADGSVSTGARRAATRRPSSRPPVLLGLAFLAVTALAAIGWLRPAGRASDQRVTAAVLPLELRTPTDVPLNESGPPVSLGPDGGFLIYVGADPDSGEATALWRRPLDRLEATPIPGTRGALAPEVHPDGTSMSFSRRRADGRANERMELPIEGGLPTPAPPARRLRDGRRLLRADSAFRLVDAQAEVPPNDRFWERDHRALHNLDVSPDGLWLARTQKVGGVDSVVLRALKPGTTHRLAAGVSPRFLTEDVLVFRAPDGTLQVGRLRPDRSGFVSAPLPLVSNVSLAGSGEAIFDVSADGTLVYAPGAAASQGRLVWVDAGGLETPFAGAEPQVYGGVTLSPDGRLAAVTVGALFGAGNIRIFDAALGSANPLTTDGWSSRPIWRRDGRTVVFLRVAFGLGVSQRAVGAPVAQRALDASAPPADLKGPWQDRTVAEFAFGPDERFAALRMSGSQGDRDILVWEVGTDSLRPFAAEPGVQERSPAVSPDGRWLLYVSDRSGRDEVYAEAFPGGGGRVQLSAEGGREPIWSRDGSRIFYRALDGWMVSARLTPALAVTGRDRQFDATPYLANQFLAVYDVGPDGRFLMIRRETQPARTDVVIIRNWVADALGRLDGGR